MSNDLELSDADYVLSMIDETFASVPQIKAHHDRIRKIADRLRARQAPAPVEVSTERLQIMSWIGTARESINDALDATAASRRELLAGALASLKKADAALASTPVGEVPAGSKMPPPDSSRLNRWGDKEPLWNEQSMLAFRGAAGGDDDPIACAEEVLDGFAAHLPMKETSFDCIGSYITAVMDAATANPPHAWLAKIVLDGDRTDSQREAAKLLLAASPAPAASKGAEASRCFEFWHGDRKVTMYPDACEGDEPVLLKVWGSNIHDEMESIPLTDKDAVRAAFDWLYAAPSEPEAQKAVARGHYREMNAAWKYLEDECSVPNDGQPLKSAIEYALAIAEDAAFKRGHLAGSKEAGSPELCPYCDGSGESTGMEGEGPDRWEVPIVCPRCKGAQTLRAAYDTLAEELPPLQLKVAQLGIFHSHATRYGWAPNQKNGMESFATLAAQWLAENASPSPAASMEVQGLTTEEAVATVIGTNHLDGRVRWNKPGSLGLPLGTSLYDRPSPVVQYITADEATAIATQHFPRWREDIQERFVVLLCDAFERALAAKNGWRLGEGRG